MNKKNIGEIRRRMKPDKNNITHIRGCYVNATKEIVFTFNETLPLLKEDVAEKYLAIFGKTLSGSLGRNLALVEFTPSQVSDGENYALLSALRAELLENDETVDQFYKKMIETYHSEEGYVILLTEDVYDVAYKSKNDEDAGDSESVFRYILCAVCPVSVTESELMCDAAERNFHSSHPDTIMKRPDVGFMFPAFEGDGANIYESLFYMKDTGHDYSDIASAFFDFRLPMPAKTQKETFQSVLSESLENECSFDVADGIRERICEIIADNKENKDDEPHAVTKRTVEKAMRDCGVSDEKIASFGESFDEAFGTGAGLPPENLVNVRQFEIKTTDVKVTVNPERKDLVAIREIDGVKYITILIDDAVEINGVGINTDQTE